MTFSLIVCGQSDNKHYFKPLWKVGEKKTMTISDETTRYESDSIISHETERITSVIEVIKEDRDSYYITLNYQNVFLKAFKKAFETLNDDLPPAYQYINLKYKVSKADGKSELLNSKEARDFIYDNYEKLKQLAEVKNPGSKDIVDLLFSPFKEIFKDKKSTEAYFGKEIGYILFPFGKNYSIGDTLHWTESAKNPFGKNDNDSISSTTYSYISDVNKTTSTCTINSILILDLSEFTKMMKQIIQKMTKKTKAKDAGEEKSKELDDIIIDMEFKETLTFNYSTTWTSKVTQNIVTIMKSPTKNSKSYSNKTVLIN